jgi:hypothetical protein
MLFAVLISTTVRAIEPTQIETRIIKTAENFINTPTGLDPLGEGEGLDPKPLFSTKKFDCTTYVETNLALGFAKTDQDAPQEMTKIRYQTNKPDYFSRNHFMVTDWIPSNSKRGYITDITSKLTQDKSAYKIDKKILNKTIWFYHRVIDLLSEQKKAPNEILKELALVPTVPIATEKATYLIASYFRDNEQAMIEALPEISIVMFIRNLPSVPTLVNHMGFIIKKSGKLYLNHAPQAKPWKVQEVVLDDYLEDMDSHRAPIDGLLFLKIQGK